MNDKEIIELFFQRKESALEETSAKYGAYCYMIAYRILQSSDDAQESVNDAYWDVWNSIPPHMPVSFSAFLGKIVRRKSIDRWRRLKAEKRGGGCMETALQELEDCLPIDTDTEQQVMGNFLTEVIDQFVGMLPETERQVFLRRYWYLESVNEIAKRTGYSVSKIKSMLHRTRKKLQDRLTAEEF